MIILQNRHDCKYFILDVDGNFLCHNILHPDSFFNQYKTDDAFQPVTDLYAGEYEYYKHGSISAEYESDGHADTPDEYTIEQEGNQCFPAGPEGKVCRM